jgi:hypothetical protein
MKASAPPIDSHGLVAKTFRLRTIFDNKNAMGHFMQALFELVLGKVFQESGLLLVNCNIRLI